MLRRNPVPSLPHTEWEKVRQHIRSNWQQGEHVSIIGPTGCGKTTLETQILDVRRFVVVFVTKIHDDVLRDEFPGFTRIEKWPPPRAWDEKVLLWPKPEKTIRGTYLKQREIFKDAIDQIFLERNWCVVFDEQHYICEELRLKPENTMLQHQGRSSGLSIVNGTQRPANIPVVTYSSATHAAIWKLTERKDAQRLADLGGVDTRDLQQNLLGLDKHSFVYVNTRAGDMIRTKIER